MKQSISVTELRKDAERILLEVQTTGVPVNITRYGKVVARIEPVLTQPTDDQIRESLQRHKDAGSKISELWTRDISAMQAIREDRGKI